MDTKIEIKEEKTTLWKWIKQRKKLLITLGVISITAIGTIITIKNRSAIKQLFIKKVTTIEEGNKVVREIAEQTAALAKKVPDDIDLSGPKYTARQLGEKMGVSANEINKRLVAKGLQLAPFNNEYAITEFGDYFGDSKWKVTRAGHSFVNNEWCEGVLKLLFNEEELAKCTSKIKV